MKPYNERLPLIDAVIEYHRGMFPSYKNKPDEILWGSPRFDDIGSYQSFTNGYKPINWEEPICTYEEFSQRARELGWVNGFKWGVEYKTNGEKPDLPDDVVIDYMIAWHSGHKKWVNGSIVSSVSWFGVEKFRIVDERYKPKENTMNNDWYEKGELPPVGAKAKLRIDDKMQEVEVVAYHGSGEHKRAWVYSVGRGYRTVLPDSLRPLRTETDKLVEQMERSFEATGCVFTNDHKALAEHLIEQGYRKTKPMSEQEFMKQCVDICGHGDARLYRAGCRFLDQGE